MAIFTGKRSRKTRRLQADEIAGLPFADLLDGINMLIKVGDPMSVLPDDTTEENFDDRFTLVIARFKMMAGENTPDDEPAELPDIVDGADILETAGAEFKSATPEQRRQLQTQLGRLKELEAAEAERLREDELKFTQFIDHKLIATGRVPVTQRDSLLLQGKQARFSLTAVQLLESIPEGTHVDATGKSKVRKLSVPSPPGLPGKETAETDEEMGNRALKLFGHDPKN